MEFRPPRDDRWAGYLDIIEVQERLGIRMDTNYLSAATYTRCIDMAPYGGFGMSSAFDILVPEERAAEARRILQSPDSR